MLRALYKSYGGYLCPLAESVLGEETILFSQGVLSAAGAMVLRCQAWTTWGLLSDGSPGPRQQCGDCAAPSPDGEALCRWHLFTAWYCSACERQLPAKGEGVRGYTELYCPACAAEVFRCAV